MANNFSTPEFLQDKDDASPIGFGMVLLFIFIFGGSAAYFFKDVWVWLFLHALAPVIQFFITLSQASLGKVLYWIFPGDAQNLADSYHLLMSQDLLSMPSQSWHRLLSAIGKNLLPFIIPIFLVLFGLCLWLLTFNGKFTFLVKKTSVDKS